MQPQAYVKSANKKSVNLTANADLIACAKENKINLTETFEEAIVINFALYSNSNGLSNTRKELMHTTSVLSETVFLLPNSGVFDGTTRHLPK